MLAGDLRLKALVVACCLLMLAACSSTTTSRPDTGSRTARDVATETPLEDEDGVLVDGEDGTPAGTTGSGPAARTGTRRTTQTAGGGNQAGPGQTQQPGTPRAGGPLKVGIRYPSEAGQAAFAASMGIGNSSPVNVRGWYEALVKHVNESGGVAGRPIDPAWYEFSQADLATDAPREAQRACAYFAEDAKVSIVLTPTPASYLMTSCLARAGIPLIAQPNSGADRKVMEDLKGYFYMPGHIQRTRAIRTMVRGLANQGFFVQGAKIGLLWFNDPEGLYKRVYNEAMIPSMRAIGRSFTSEFEFGSYTSQQQYSSAVLRFRNAGVTHVMIMEPASGLMALQFMTHAENQVYRPHYGLTSDSSPVFLSLAVPPSQLRMSNVVGWMPTLDVETAQDPGRTAASKRCLDILARAGHRPGNDRIADAGMNYSCETIFYLKIAADRAGEASAGGLLRATEAMGQSYDPTSTFATQLGPGRYDGARIARQVIYDQRCSCWTYVGNPYPMES